MFFPIIFISWRLITLQYCSGFCHALTWISHGFTRVLHPELPSHLPPHPIPLVIPVDQPQALVSCIQPGLAICFTLDNIHVSMLFSQIIPPLPSPIESKSLFYTSVSLFLSCIWGYYYHLSNSLKAYLISYAYVCPFLHDLPSISENYYLHCISISKES